MLRPPNTVSIEFVRGMLSGVVSGRDECRGWLDWSTPTSYDDRLRFCRAESPERVHAYTWDARSHVWGLVTAGYATADTHE